MQLTFIGKFLVFGSHLYSEFCSPVRYAKFQLIRYFIDIDILQNSLIDIDIFKKVHIDIDSDIDIFKNDHVDLDIDINIFQIVLIDIDIFKISLSISIPISIFSKNAYRYFVDIDILTKIVDILSIFQKMPIYRQSISIFHQKSMKKVLNLLKKMILSISILISIFSILSLSISIFFKSVDISTIDISYRYIEQNRTNDYFLGKCSLIGGDDQ